MKTIKQTINHMMKNPLQTIGDAAVGMGLIAGLYGLISLWGYLGSPA